jgi:hypothetical protein
MFRTKDSNNLQLDYIQNNEANVLESFIQIFGMTNTYASEFSAIPKSNYLVPNPPRY